MNILFVDDEIYLRECLDLILSSEGYDVFTASNGKEALTIMSQQELDLIITDIDMPEMNGIEFIHEVKKKRNLPVRVIAMSGGDREGWLEKASYLGADKTFSKPFSVNEFLEVVRNLCIKPHSTLSHH